MDDITKEKKEEEGNTLFGIALYVLFSAGIISIPVLNTPNEVIIGLFGLAILIAAWGSYILRKAHVM